jgi:hypothetical protein
LQMRDNVALNSAHFPISSPFGCCCHFVVVVIVVCVYVFVVLLLRYLSIALRIYLLLGISSFGRSSL